MLDVLGREHVEKNMRSSLSGVSHLEKDMSIWMVEKFTSRTVEVVFWTIPGR